VPDSKDALQAAVQLRPVGLLVTAPLPFMARVNVRVTIGSGDAVNVAVTVRALSISTVQVLALVVLHPDQLVKADPEVAVAVRVTVVLLLRLALQLDPQLMPPVLLVTVPLPVPDFATVSVRGVGSGSVPVLNLARMEKVRSIVTRQVVDVAFGHASLSHPRKVLLFTLVAVRVIRAPFPALMLHDVLPEPHVMLAGLLVTLPDPITVTSSKSALAGCGPATIALIPSIKNNAARVTAAHVWRIAR